ncbi:hypothetical protein OQA88_5615 [Cercophora sp. LCS_1]
MSIHTLYPEYLTTLPLDDIRETEYPHLDANSHTYLDYTGTSLPSLTQLRTHHARLTSDIYGNPHSINPTSSLSTDAINSAKARILSHLNASPSEYAVIFTPNASGAARLVGESYPFSRRTRFVLTADNHNSINGLREFARKKSSRVSYIPVHAPELRVDAGDVIQALPKKGRLRDLWCGRSHAHDESRNGLFAYPAQSNFSGVKHPLTWVSMAQERGYDVLLDAAAYLPTNQLDLGVTKPEFVTVSWYKVFGYPTGVGCLVAKKEALRRLKRPWFSGGTVMAAAVGIDFHKMAEGGEGFEDGTVNFASIPDVEVGLDWVSKVGRGMVETRVKCLTGWFLKRLLEMRHSDGFPMAVVYGPHDMKMRGGTVAFNFLDTAGKVVDERLVAYESAAAMISLRTGCFCNPGVGESAFGLDVKVLNTFYKRDEATMDDYVQAIGLPSGGAIRVSFGIASTAKDVDKFFGFAEKTYKDRHTSSIGLPPREHC